MPATTPSRSARVGEVVLYRVLAADVPGPGWQSDGRLLAPLNAAGAQRPLLVTSVISTTHVTGQLCLEGCAATVYKGNVEHGTDNGMWELQST